jgi:hypothetical protein
MFPFEIREEVQKANEENSRFDKIVPLVVTNNQNKEEMVGFQLVGVRLTVTQRLIQINYKVDEKGNSLENDPRSPR